VRVVSGSFWPEQHKRRVAADLWTRPIDLNLRSTCRQQLQYYTHHCHYYSAWKLMLILPSHGG